jgi:hypothetical protein
MGHATARHATARHGVHVFCAVIDRQREPLTCKAVSVLEFILSPTPCHGSLLRVLPDACLSTEQKCSTCSKTQFWDKEKKKRKKKEGDLLGRVGGCELCGATRSRATLQPLQESNHFGGFDKAPALTGRRRRRRASLQCNKSSVLSCRACPQVT